VKTARRKSETGARAGATGRRYRGASLNQRRASRRQQLLQAGIDLFGTRGYHAVTVREICAAAGLTERYFYESFRDREQLFGAVYEHLNTQLAQKLAAAVAGAGGDLELMARRGLRAYFEQTRDDPKGARIMLIEHFGLSADMDRLSRRTAIGFVEMLRQTLAPRLLGSRRRELDPDLLATGLVGGVIFSAMRWVLSGYQQPLDAVVDNSAAIFTSLLRS
jgi:AcrR family transcriptional regulator